MSDSETEDSYPQTPSPKTTDDDEKSLTNFAFDKLPTDVLVGIFKHARPVNAEDAYTEGFRFPVALTQVCQHWRKVALEAPTLWANMHIMDYYTKQNKEAACVYVERSKACPLFLTWFSTHRHTRADVQEVVRNLVIRYAERWQRITLITDNAEAPGALLAEMGPRCFPILRDIEISCLPDQLPPSKLTLCRNAPLLRRCTFRNIHSLPPTPSNLVVFDYVAPTEPINLGSLLDFLPHVAHSLEHLRLGPSTPDISAVPRRSKVPLENLKSLLVKDSHVIMGSILAPNLTYFAALHSPGADAQEVAEMFNGFSAPKLQSIRFHQTPLLPLLTSHNLPSMFPQLESVAFIDCIGESAFAPLLEPRQPGEPSSCPPKDRKVENPFPKLKELTVSDKENWASLQAAIEKRLKNGDRLPKQDIELVLYESGEWSAFAPLEIQDDFCSELSHLFKDVVKEEWEYKDGDEYRFYYEYHGHNLDQDPGRWKN